MHFTMYNDEMVKGSFAANVTTHRRLADTAILKAKDLASQVCAILQKTKIIACGKGERRGDLGGGIFLFCFLLVKFQGAILILFSFGRTIFTMRVTLSRQRRNPKP